MGTIEPSDALILTINEKAIRDIANEGEHLYKSVSDLVLYATGAAACSTSDLLMVLESVNKSLDSIEQHLNRAYIETWRYIQVRIGYWKSKITGNVPNGKLLTVLSDGGAMRDDWIIDGKRGRR